MVWKQDNKLSQTQPNYTPHLRLPQRTIRYRTAAGKQAQVDLVPHAMPTAAWKARNCKWSDVIITATTQTTAWNHSFESVNITKFRWATIGADHWVISPYNTLLSRSYLTYV